MNPQLTATITERAFMDQVLELANLCGWLCYHTHTSKYSRPGFPDPLLLRHSRLVVAELKREGKYPTPEQQRWLNAFSGARAEAYLWHPSDWPVIESILK